MTAADQLALIRANCERDEPRRQTCRLLKVECPTCGYIARVTRKWLDARGAPICPTDQEPMIGGGE